METFFLQENKKNKEKSLNRTMQYGNHSAFFVILCGFIGLNRTMQYGNPLIYGILDTPPESLNRTMQYGNYRMTRLKHLDYVWFKSYYVVWKLFRYFEKKEYMREFKSYYVVWKQRYMNELIASDTCLNRTMQYGNQMTNTKNVNSKRV